MDLQPIGKRTSKSAVKIAVDMVKQINFKKNGYFKNRSRLIRYFASSTLDEKSEIQVIANGLPASPGAASGKVVFTSEDAERLMCYKTLYWLG